MTERGWRELPDGALEGSDGVVYRRTPQRVTRRLGRELLQAGASVVTDVYPKGTTWYEDRDAVDAWAKIERHLVVGRRSEVVFDMLWVGHVWESDSGRVILRFDGQH